MLVISQQQIADLFGVSRETIDTWQKLDMPVEAHGGPGVPSRYDSVKCIAWKIETEVRKVQGERPQDWLAREQATSKSMDNAIRRGELIPAGKIEPAMRAAFVAAREFFRNEPTRLAREIQEKTIQEAEDLISRSFDIFLTKLSKWSPAQVAEDVDVETCNFLRIIDDDDK